MRLFCFHFHLDKQHANAIWVGRYAFAIIFHVRVSSQPFHFAFCCCFCSLSSFFISSLIAFKAIHHWYQSVHFVCARKMHTGIFTARDHKWRSIRSKRVQYRFYCGQTNEMEIKAYSMSWCAHTPSSIEHANMHGICKCNAKCTLLAAAVVCFTFHFLLYSFFVLLLVMIKFLLHHFTKEIKHNASHWMCPFRLHLKPTISKTRPPTQQFHRMHKQSTALALEMVEQLPINRRNAAILNLSFIPETNEPTTHRRTLCIRYFSELFRRFDSV